MSLNNDNLQENILIVKDKLNITFNKKDISSENILQVARTGMEIVGNFNDIKGSQKKFVVISAVNLIIDELPIDDDIKEVIKFILNKIGPPVIDDLISAFKGDFTFKRSTKTFCPCISK